MKYENHHTSPEQHYHFYEAIGSGTYSTVYRAEHLITHDIVAIKVIPKEKLRTKTEIALLKTEFYVCKKLDHPHIVHFFDAFEDDNYIYFVIENGERGEISNSIQKGPLSETRARIILVQILSALDYLHNEVHIIHRDLKLENIVLDHYHNVRIADFGLSTFFDPDNPNLTHVVGSPAYVAPELVLHEPYSTPIDIWCVGVLLYTMTVGHLPFCGSNSDELARSIVYSNPNYPSFISLSLRDLLSHILDKNPQKRYNIAQIRDHPWCSYVPLNLNSFRITPNQDNPNLDPTILEQMHSLSVDTTNLPEIIARVGITRESAIYRILKTHKISQILSSYESSLHNSVSISNYEKSFQSFVEFTPNGSLLPGEREKEKKTENIKVPLKRMSKTLYISDESYKKYPLPKIPFSFSEKYEQKNTTDFCEDHSDLLSLFDH